MSERARAWLRRHAMLLAAVLLHIALLRLMLPYMVNRTEPLPSDSLDVMIVPPPPAPKPVRPPPPPPPPARPAETNSSASRPKFKPVPHLNRPAPPRLRLPPPPPLPIIPPMTLPVPSGPPITAAPAAGTPGGGAGGPGGDGTGRGTQEGIDYLARIKAYIDAHKSGARHRTPHDADVVLVLDQDGRLTDIRVVASTGDASVDEDIVTQLKRMSPYPKPPPTLFSPAKPVLPVADKWIFPR